MWAAPFIISDCGDFSWLFHATIYLLKFPNKWKGLLIQSATVCFVEVTDKLADCRSEQLRSGVKIRPRTNQRLFLQTITIVNKSAQTMFNISFYNYLYEEIKKD